MSISSPDPRAPRPSSAGEASRPPVPRPFLERQTALLHRLAAAPTAADVRSLLRAAAELVEDTLTDVRVAVMEAGADGSLSVAAAPSLPSRFQGSVDENLPWEGAKAVRERKVEIGAVNGRDWQTEAGLESCWAVPIPVEGPIPERGGHLDGPAANAEVAGVLVVYVPADRDASGNASQHAGEAPTDAEWAVVSAAGQLVQTALGRLRETRSRPEPVHGSSVDYNTEWWNRLVEAHPDPIMISVDGEIRYVNPAGVRAYGADTADQIVGRSLMHFVDDADEEAMRRRAQAVYEKRRPTAPYEHEITRIDGEKRVVETRSVPIEYGGRPAAQTMIRDVTAERTLQEKLHLSQERIRRLLENAQPIVFVLDTEGTFLVAEGEDLSALGLKPGALVGHSIYNLLAHRPDVLNHAERALDGQVVDTVAEIGEAVLDLWGAPVHDADGNVVGCIGMGVDVTERTRAEAALESERGLLTQIFDTSPVAITVLNTEGKIIKANARAEEVLGLSASDVESRSYDDPEWSHSAVDGGPFPDEEQPFVRVMETKAPVYDVKHAIEWPNGERRLVSVSGAPLRGQDGQITGAVFVVEDVTERMRQRQTLRRREEKVRALYDAMSSLLELESAGEVADLMLTLINDTFGYSISAIRFEEDGVLVPVCVTEETRRLVGHPRPDYDVDGDSIVARAFRKRETAVFDDVRDTEEAYDRGETRAAAYIPIGSRGIITVGSTEVGALDPFDVHLLEILAHNADGVLDRLQTEVELREARDAAEEASRLKSAMLANMSHEVRTPLTSIIGFAEVIGDEVEQADELGDNVQRFAQLIRDSSVRLKDTLDSVLQLSELEAGAGTMEAEVVDPEKEVRGMADDVSERALTAGIHLNVDVGPVEPIRLPGASVLRRILQNLVDNAIKFTPEGGTVAVRATGTAERLWLEVEDTGVGMSPEFQEQMFQAFKQESEGLRRSHEGSGLGLAIVDKIVDLAGGRVEVESVPGQGTRFSVFLPCQ